MASEHVHEFTDENFQNEVLDSDTPVLVDFWAEWCMPCRALSPIIDELASEFQGRVKIGKVDIDSNRNVTAANNVNAIPTVIVFKGGEPVQKFFGLESKEKLVAVLNDVAG
ncbi:MAG: thioredoxin [Phycisphaerales bacterium]|nr:thioredoxin [Phycisphaerales bacterium]